MPDKILTLAEVAQVPTVVDKTLYTVAQRGEVLAFKVCGQRRFKRADLDHWIEQQKLCQGNHDNLTGTRSKGRSWPIRSDWKRRSGPALSSRSGRAKAPHSDYRARPGVAPG